MVSLPRQRRATPMTQAPTTDELRAVAVALADKFTQLEQLLERYHDRPGVADSLASLGAWRGTVRRLLAALRAMDERAAEAGEAARLVRPPTPTRLDPAPLEQGRPAHKIFEK